MKDKHCFQVERAADGLIMLRIQGPSLEDSHIECWLTRAQADTLINDMIDALDVDGKQRYAWNAPRLVGGER